MRPARCFRLAPGTTSNQYDQARMCVESLIFIRDGIVWH